MNPSWDSCNRALATAWRLRTLWHMKDLFANVPLPQARIFKTCYRLVARGRMQVDLGNVLWDHSKFEVAA